ncbi:ribonuclease P protein component [Hansschlegelia sp. KR7-227]|uniref:ribonuclease P protein component n=1 Tax=Hansschlegelia sp. KR7-227 TaxID=3400914 RepID=UPI003C020944
MPKIAASLDMLRVRSEFVTAAKDGVKVGGPLVGLQWRDRGEPQTLARVGFTVTKRVGGSVERTRMKRRLRAAAGQVLADLARPGCDYVLIARRTVLDAPFERLTREVREVARRAHGRARSPNAAPAGPLPPDGRRESGR